jgi:hypothetical protein
MKFEGTQDQIDGQKRLIRQTVADVIKDAGGGLPFGSTISSAYTVGEPQTQAPGDAAAAGEGHSVIMGYGWMLPKPGQRVVEIPIGNSTAIAYIGELPTGSLATNGAWIVPDHYLTTRSTLGFTSAALRCPCPVPILVSKVYVSVATSQTNATARIKVYDSLGSAGQLFLDSGDIDCGGASGPQGVTLGSPVQLPAGNLVVEYTSNNNLMLVSCSVLATNAGAFQNAGTTQRATSASMASTSTSDFPWIKFQS